MIRRIVACFAVVLGASSAGAQSMDMHAGMHHASASVSAKAQKQIDSVAKANLPLGAPGAAANAGFHPVFGWIPTMGEHWVAQARMDKRVQMNRATPSQLMFSRIGGKDSLVGAAFGYLTTLADSLPPQLFDGAPEWHEHPDLAPPGSRLVMLHVWFVPSPDGPFAGTNPNLPFWAVGLAAPDSSRFKDEEFSTRVRKASLALAEVADSTVMYPTLKRRVGDQIAARRDSVRALIPEFRAAEKSKDKAAWDRAATKAAAQWDGMYATYLSVVRTPAVKARVENYAAMLLGKHHE
jgi:hypothetical protein